MILRNAHDVHALLWLWHLETVDLEPAAVVSAKLVASLKLMRGDPATVLHPERVLGSRPGLADTHQSPRGTPENCIGNLFTIKTLLERAGPRMGPPSMGAFLSGDGCLERTAPA